MLSGGFPGHVIWSSRSVYKAYSNRWYLRSSWKACMLLVRVHSVPVGVLPEKCSGSVRNPYPLPYFRPKSAIFPTLCQAGTKILIAILDLTLNWHHVIIRKKKLTQFEAREHKNLAFSSLVQLKFSSNGHGQDKYVFVSEGTKSATKVHLTWLSWIENVNLTG